MTQHITYKLNLVAIRTLVVQYAIADDAIGPDIPARAMQEFVFMSEAIELEIAKEPPPRLRNARTACFKLAITPTTLTCPRRNTFYKHFSVRVVWGWEIATHVKHLLELLVRRILM